MAHEGSWVFSVPLPVLLFVGETAGPRQAYARPRRSPKRAPRDRRGDRVKPYPTGFREPQRPVTRWRVYFLGHDPVVVMATDEDAARRAGAFFSFGSVVGVEPVE